MKEFTFEAKLIARVRVRRLTRRPRVALFSALLERPALQKTHWPMRVMNSTNGASETSAWMAGPCGCRHSRTFPRPSAGILIKTSEPRRRRSKVSTGHTYEA
jgi:hypothetical protein